MEEERKNEVTEMEQSEREHEKKKEGEGEKVEETRRGV